MRSSSDSNTSSKVPTRMNVPSIIMATRSPVSFAQVRSCVMMMELVLNLVCTSRMSSLISIEVMGSSPEVGSSYNMISGLDPITSIEINELIREVQTKFRTSSIIITHDLTCAKVTGDRVAMMIEGTFIRVGTFDEVFESDDERIQSFYKYNFTESA